MITPELIAQIRAALDAATPGEWREGTFNVWYDDGDLLICDLGQGVRYHYDGGIRNYMRQDTEERALADSRLIPLLRNHAPALLDEIERLRAENALQHSQLLEQAINVLPDRDATIERLRKELERITNDRNNQLDRLRAAAGHAEWLRARIAELEAENEQQKWYVNHITEYRNAAAELLEYMFPMPNTPCGDDDVIAAPRYAIQELERLRARVAELESTLDIHLKSATRTQQEIVEGNWERQ